MTYGRPPRASCSTILFARPVRFLIVAVIFCFALASLRWTPPSQVSAKLSHYFDHDRDSKFPDQPTKASTLAQEFAEKYDTNEQAGMDDDRARPGSHYESAITKPEHISTDPDSKSLKVIKKPYESPETSPYAYVFYATEDTYACSVLVNIDRLQNKLKTIYPIYVLATAALSQPYLDAFKVRGVIVSVQEVPPLADGSAGYYRDCLVKLLAFRMHRVNPHLKRIIIMDSDQLILQNVDNLFEGLPEVDLAAPRAYWIAKDFVSSTFMVIGLSERLWITIENQIKNITNGKYDMDLVNDVLGDTVLMLPGKYITMNSHWEVWGIPKWYHDPEQFSNETAMLHVPGPSTTSTPAPASLLETAGQDPVAVLPNAKGVDVTSKDKNSPVARLVKRVLPKKGAGDGEEDEAEEDTEAIGFSKLQSSQAPSKDAAHSTGSDDAKPAKAAALSGGDKETLKSSGSTVDGAAVKAEAIKPVVIGEAKADSKSTQAKAVKPIVPGEAKGSSKLSDPSIDNPTTQAKTAKPIVPDDAKKNLKSSSAAEAATDQEKSIPAKAAKPVVPVDAMEGSKSSDSTTKGGAGAEDDDEEEEAVTPSKAGQDANVVADDRATSADANDSTPSSDKQTEETKPHKVAAKPHPPAHTKPMGPKEQRPHFKELYHLYDSAPVLHFFALGKPWTWKYEDVLKNRPDSHPLFYEQFKEWRMAALRLCPPGVINEV